LLNNDPTICQACGACKQFPCVTDCLAFEGLSFADSISIDQLKTMSKT
jgi:hypothetical protein